MQTICAGLVFAGPKLFPLPETRFGFYISELVNVIEKCPELIMVVIPNNKVPENNSDQTSLYAPLFLT